MKIRINGSESADTDLEYNVCSHLREILGVLEMEGISWDKAKPLATDKDGGHSLKLNGKINFQLISERFEVPGYIELLPKYKSVICRRCWCDIEGK